MVLPTQLLFTAKLEDLPTQLLFSAKVEDLGKAIRQNTFKK